MHPSARMLMLCVWALLIESVDARQLCVLLLLAGAALTVSGAFDAFLRLVRRARWLLVVLALTYAWTVPGAALWPGLGLASPTFSGIEAGAWRALRLSLMIAGVALLLETTPVPRLVYGLYVLTTPFARLIDRRAFAVRLGLTLAAASDARPSKKLADMLAADREKTALPDVYKLPVEPWRLRDSLLTGTVFVVIALASVG